MQFQVKSGQKLPRVWATKMEFDGLDNYIFFPTRDQAREQAKYWRRNFQYESRLGNISVYEVTFQLSRYR